MPIELKLPNQNSPCSKCKDYEALILETNAKIGQLFNIFGDLKGGNVIKLLPKIQFIINKNKDFFLDLMDISEQIKNTADGITE